MLQSVSEKLIEAHLEGGEMTPGAPIRLRIDQTLTQDATGTLAMLSLEAMALDRVTTEASVQYVDHNLLQIDNLNPDDHRFLESAAKRFGLWYSRPGNGISHVVHMHRFGKPGRTLLGSDSHTPAAGALGMLAIGAGGLDVALAMSGEPFSTTMPEIMGVKLVGELPDWVSAKDVILEMLRRHGVAGGVGRIIEYYGPGLASLSAMDRHVIANMGAELGATTTVFPSDGEVRAFLESEDRGADWTEIVADAGCTYAQHDEIDLSRLEPLIAKPSSPGNVVPVSEVAGTEIYQAYVGSSANPGWRDFAIAAEIVRGRSVPPSVSFDINPSSRQVLEMLIADGRLGILVAAGGRIHQAGCNGCIGMGQAPAIGQNSLRTVPRNFPGRSGTREDSVFLCSPETAAASACTGTITDPRSLGGLRRASAARSGTSSTPQCWSPRRRPENRGRSNSSRGRTSARCPSSIRCPTLWICRSCSRWTTTCRPTRSCRRAPRCFPTAPISRRSPAFPSSALTRPMLSAPRGYPTVPVTPSWLGRTTVRARRASMRRSGRAISAFASCWPRAWPASIARI